MPLQFSAVPNEPGTFQASVAAETSGEYRVAITLEDGEQVTIDTRFRAELPIRETRDTWLDRDLLQRIAKEKAIEEEDYAALTERALTLRRSVEEGRAGIEWGISGVPETFIVGGDGRVRSTWLSLQGVQLHWRRSYAELPHLQWSHGRGGRRR